MKLTLRSLDGIYQIAELSGHAAEVLRTLSSRHRIYTVYFAFLLLLIADEVEWLKMLITRPPFNYSNEFCILLFLIHMFEETGFVK